jgi:hypothetical protein
LVSEPPGWAGLVGEPVRSMRSGSTTVRPTTEKLQITYTITLQKGEGDEGKGGAHEGHTAKILSRGGRCTLR